MDQLFVFAELQRQQDFERALSFYDKEGDVFYFKEFERNYSPLTEEEERIILYHIYKFKSAR